MGPPSYPNFIGYKMLRDMKILCAYEGQYICIVDGRLVDHGYDREAVLNRVRKKFQDKPRYFTQVINNWMDEPIPMPMSAEDIE